MNNDVEPVLTKAQQMRLLADKNNTEIDEEFQKCLRLIEEKASYGYYECIYGCKREMYVRIIKEKLHSLGFKTGYDSFVYGSKFYVYW